MNRARLVEDVAELIIKDDPSISPQVSREIADAVIHKVGPYRMRDRLIALEAWLRLGGDTKQFAAFLCGSGSTTWPPPGAQ